MGKKISVAIDGPAGAGKSTIARRLAGELGFRYVAAFEGRKPHFIPLEG